MAVLASYPSLVLHLHAGPHYALETEWLGFTSSPNFRRYVTEALRLARQHGVTGWIANDSWLGAVRPVDLEWVAQEVLPAMADLGVRRFARLESQETLNRMLIGSMYQEAAPDVSFEVRAFADLTTARAWACA
ncbi:hypothetical protein HNQ93_000585 [Hymenobacter luteus]|uniref:STAS/SEC14 domain-containing protein n=2 Tax=Hymenobacter TaxID=89966 RepID=A0A7W9WAW4_9BACT|nr:MULTISPECIES: hypothetical protein [Hymenobacter]MBB4599935.1 hypothetical protein [Hymenobacter latericoloratus]MBB6057755.1 hypothetical protein [Hymenobacter luteus]